MLTNIPNILTLLRIVAIPVFIVIFYLPWSEAHFWATFIFCAAAITDWLDGYLARKLEQTSAFGAFLDPVADKLIVVMALIMLIERNPTPFPDVALTIACGIIIGREIVISALREWMAEIGERAQVAVSVIGKIKTLAQMFAIPFLIYEYDIGEFPTSEVGFVLIWIAAALTIWSMVIYLKGAWPIIKNSDDFANRD
ncbi:MAG: CDP-diacylglycerol--glycerol-3-phosphate 3-phosphatidyltransferase [Gammaproteobacteria bacterium]|nr:CDP-diacylglycerol--glycerol-3-phosphate 3-phosphatidyltransferase [Gammaproteobacteria bacterium]